jgi:hypothetical protein
LGWLPGLFNALDCVTARRAVRGPIFRFS